MEGETGSVGMMQFVVGESGDASEGRRNWMEMRTEMGGHSGVLCVMWGMYWGW